MGMFRKTIVFKALLPIVAPLNRLHGHLPPRTIVLLGELAVALLFGWLLISGIGWLEMVVIPPDSEADTVPVWVSLLQLAMTVTKLATTYWLVGYLTGHTLSLHDLPDYYSVWIILGLIALVTIILRKTYFSRSYRSCCGLFFATGPTGQPFGGQSSVGFATPTC